jgi:hypothetical protein
MLLATAHASELVEIRLIDDIDEARGYCLDIAGGRGTSAPLDKGLQAHTCYDYTGGLLEDQSFEATLLEDGTFKIPYFDVCMSVPAIEPGAAITLSPCAAVETQMFSLKDNGNIVISGDTELCVTTSSTQKREGRGGTPVHVMRPLSLQPCSDEKKAYQAWTVFRI